MESGNNFGVQATNDDASQCKLSAIKLGYWKDEFLQSMIDSGPRRAPEINRGYFARVRGVGLLIEQFFERVGGNGQIINLGSGFDTLFWKLKSSNVPFKKFVELDFPAVTARKIWSIKKKPLLANMIQEEGEEVIFDKTNIHSKSYHLIGVDLRDVKDLDAKLRSINLDFSAPTLFISECVLVYIEYPLAQNMLSWISSTFISALFICYDPINMSDKFGEVMISNLRAQGCHLAGIDACTSLESQKQRYLSAGWDGVDGADMCSIYGAIPYAERSVIEKIEFLDEQELLTQLFQHYSICCAWKGKELENISIT
ncbi:unnamed protein product [Bemisia tabaci]|uniref:Leucine carboxyl methyltransferase 1 n=1 Tax=Bemisia tabaci TaxID=7038 RepID=A0A9P0AHR9_BEMTA|nr:PREDICTED: leucine carboxyl methyltransferase 1 [Bemisia tabaci]CAH0391860.1 unnamed protein product [Bemisia tabaci]